MDALGRSVGEDVERCGNQTVEGLQVQTTAASDEPFFNATDDGAKAMMKAFVCVLGAIAFNAAVWVAHLAALLGQAAHGDVTGYLNAVQLGGTAGLIACLFGAVVVLWRERVILYDMIAKERRLLLEELRTQIDDLRIETHKAIEEKTGDRN